MKTAKIFLAILLSVLMVMTVSTVAFAEGENWVQIKTSGADLGKGDYYVDLQSLKAEYLERFIYQNLSDYCYMKDAHWSPSYPEPDTFNNLEIAGVEKLAGLYPALWNEALQEAHDAAPSYAIDSFSNIQDAWDILVDKVIEQGLVEGIESWADLMEYGRDYLENEHPSAFEQCTADAEAEFADYENATYYYDSAFSGMRWLKAEHDGEELYLSDDIMTAFTVYGVEWISVVADEASVGSEGGWYFNGNAIEVPFDEEYINSIRESGEWICEMYIGRIPTDILVSEDDLRHVTTEEELREAVNAIVEGRIAEYKDMITSQYEHFFDNIVLYVNADEDELFSLKLVQTVTDPMGGTYSQTMYLPLAEHTYMYAGGVSVDMIFDCIDYVEPETPDDPVDPDDPVNPDDPSDPDTPDEGKGVCPWARCGKTHSDDIFGRIIKVAHYILALFDSVLSVFNN